VYNVNNAYNDYINSHKYESNVADYYIYKFIYSAWFVHICFSCLSVATVFGKH